MFRLGMEVELKSVVEVWTSEDLLGNSGFIEVGGVWVKVNLTGMTFPINLNTILV